MGGGRKKKFIDKKAATTYNVVHRSQQDGAFGLEDRPSERVLLAQAPVNAARRARVTRAGFADDGYDYERHLRAGGGGVFVGADGSVSSIRGIQKLSLSFTMIAAVGAKRDVDTSRHVEVVVSAEEPHIDPVELVAVGVAVSASRPTWASSERASASWTARACSMTA